MPLQIDRIRALCFDIDGTLSDTDDAYVQRVARWLRPGRAFLSGRDEYRLARRIIMAIETPGNLLHGYSDRLDLDGLMAGWSDYMFKRGWQRSNTRYILMQGVRQLLVDLKPLFPLAIVSSRGERTSRVFLEQHDLSQFFQVIVTGQTVQHNKPFPDPILFAAQKMNVSPQACLMIGDTTVDILAGKAAGAQTVGVLCGFGESAELQNAGANLILNTTAELAQVLF